ncbi:MULTISPECIES: hypothetical protein [Pseudomonas]|uniref:hypothetical protein n=1 Tax=Pseudomonas nitroreducens TaxID=46680 RepID=UPI001E3B013D|nr:MULTISPECIES: hypothetical protein [Pseudomonas]MCE4070121.1 hypothetical protein [Pseudomonas nitritireducens]MCE4078726.1 hypothetical protein [Pseudomonas nitroreducens]
MKIKALRNTQAGGEELLAGKTYTVTPQDGRYLVSIGKAEEVEEGAASGNGRTGKSTRKTGAPTPPAGSGDENPTNTETTTTEPTE